MANEQSSSPMAEARLYRQNRRIEQARVSHDAAVPLISPSKTTADKTSIPVSVPFCGLVIDDDDGLLMNIKRGASESNIQQESFRCSSNSSLDDWSILGSSSTKDRDSATALDDGFLLYTAPKSKKHTGGATLQKTVLKAQGGESDVCDTFTLFGEALTSPDFLQQAPGMHDGQVLFVQHANGDLSAHQWVESLYQWIKIGKYCGISKRIEGQLAYDRLEGEVANTLQENTLAYFCAIAKQREAKSIKLHADPARENYTPLKALMDRSDVPRRAGSGSLTQGSQPPPGDRAAGAHGHDLPYTGPDVSNAQRMDPTITAMPTRSISSKLGGNVPDTNFPEARLGSLSLGGPNAATRDKDDPFVVKASSSSVAQQGQSDHELNPGSPIFPFNPKAHFIPSSGDSIQISKISVTSPQIPPITSIRSPINHGRIPPLVAASQIHNVPIVRSLSRNAFHVRAAIPSASLSHAVMNHVPRSNVQSFSSAASALRSTASHLLCQANAKGASNNGLRSISPQSTRDAMRDHLIRLGEAAKERNISQADVRLALSASSKLAAAESESRLTTQQLSTGLGKLFVRGLSASTQAQCNGPNLIRSPYAHDDSAGLQMNTGRVAATRLVHDGQCSKDDVAMPGLALRELIPGNGDSGHSGGMSSRPQAQDSRVHDQALNNWWTSDARFARQQQLFDRALVLSQTPIAPSLTRSLADEASSDKSTASASGSDVSPLSYNPSSTRVLLAVADSLATYVQGPAGSRRDYWSAWTQPPEWCIDRSVSGNDSFYDHGWGNPPARVGRDSRYRPLQDDMWLSKDTYTPVDSGRFVVGSPRAATGREMDTPLKHGGRNVG